MSLPDTQKGSIAWMARNPVAANLLMMVFILGGALFAGTVTQEVFPEFSLDRISVTVPFRGASPVDVEKGVLLALEEQVRGLDGIKKVTSNAYEGAGRVSIELSLGADPNKALQEIKNAVDRITSFPEEAERPLVSLDTNKRIVVSLVIYGDQEPGVIRMLGEMAREELLASPGITQVEIESPKNLEVSVEVPGQVLRSYNLTIDQVADAIRRYAVELPAGGVKTSGGEILLRTDERRYFASEFHDVPIIATADGTTVRLGDVARIVDGFEDSDQETLFFGKPAIEINVYRVGDETPAQISRDVEAYIEELNGRLPEGTRAAIWEDRSVILGQRMNLLLKNAALGLTLVLFLLGMFLRIRLAFWVTLGIPISVLGAFLTVPMTGVTINMISLFAFIVTLGIIVDDAVVVGENIFEMKERGLDSTDAAIAGAASVSVPIVFSILTNIVAFAPLAFVSGMMGKFFKTIPFIVIPVFIVSLIESLYVLPAHLSHLSPPRQKGLIGILNRYQAKVSDALSRFIKRVYAPAISRALELRYLTVAIAAASLIVVAGFVAGGHVDFGFFPRIERDAVTATATLPFGSPVEETRKIQRRLEETALEVLAANGGDQITLGVLSQIGGGSGQGGGGSSSNVASVRILLVSSETRKITTGAITKQWREKVGDIPGLESLTYRFATGPGGGAAIDVELSHTDLILLEAAAGRVAEALGRFDGVKDIDDGFESGKPQYNLRLKPVARALGITTNDLARQVRGAIEGSEALRQQRGRNEVRVVVRLPENERRSRQSVESMLIRTPAGGEIPLIEAAFVERGRGSTEIKRVDGRRVVNVTADVTPGGANAEKVVAELSETFFPSLKEDFPALKFGFAGEQQDRSESLRSLLIGFALAQFLIYVLIAIPFKSYAQPLIVMSAIPFGIVGAFIGHVLMGYEISIMSLFGIVALTGVVVNDSLVLIHAANEKAAEGASRVDAIQAAAVRRFRPILLTSLTTFFGLAPMIFETSVQARFLIPMAISLGFGILFATLIVLFLVPALYLVIEDVKRR